MAVKRRRRGRPWWCRRKALRALAMAATAVLAVAALAWLVLRPGGGDGTGEYLVQPAPPFTLPTIAGEEVSLADHRERHNVLLYFNEGMG